MTSYSTGSEPPLKALQGCGVYLSVAKALPGLKSKGLQAGMGPTSLHPPLPQFTTGDPSSRPKWETKMRFN